MKVENREALDTVTARFFKGLGDSVRLRILEFLQGGEKSVGEIVEHLGLPQNQVSMLSTKMHCYHSNKITPH